MGNHQVLANEQCSCPCGCRKPSSGVLCHDCAAELAERPERERDMDEARRSLLRGLSNLLLILLALACVAAIVHFH